MEVQLQPDGGHELADIVSKMGRYCRTGVRVREPRCRSNRAGSCPFLLRHASCVGQRAVEAHFNGTLHRSPVKIRVNTAVFVISALIRSKVTHH